MVGFPARPAGLGVADVMSTLGSVHSFREVAMAPDGKHVVYGMIVTGRRGGSAVDVSALDERDIDAEVRLLANV